MAGAGPAGLLAGAEPVSQEGVLTGVMAETVAPGRALSLRGLLSSLLG